MKSRIIYISLLLVMLSVLILSCEPSEQNVTYVALNKSTFTLSVGSTEQLIATVAPTTATNKSVTWSSSNEEFASVSEDGLVTAVAAGTVTITVITVDGGFMAESNATIFEPCPEGYIGDGDSIKGTGCTVYIEESYAGELFYDSDDVYFKYWETVERFYDLHEDNYDFIVFFPASRQSANFNVGVNCNIQGINKYPEYYERYPKLKSHVTIDAWSCAGNCGKDPFTDVVIHEIGHNWLAFIDDPYADTTVHWKKNLDPFEGSTDFIDPMGNTLWVIDEEGNETCVSGSQVASGEVSYQFSNLSLYLMGLIPPEEMGYIKVHDYQLRPLVPENSFFNEHGPDCNDEHQFTGTRIFTVSDVVAANGMRIPTYENSQKDFNVVLVVVGKKDQNVDSLLPDVSAVRNALSEAWSQQTGSRSNLFIE